ncbi:MAG: recombinase family protein [Bacilli bacterium]
MPVCAIYARVSDEEQVKGESVAHQISFLQELAKRRSNEEQEPWVTPESYVYRDEGISGTSILKRAAVQEMIRAAKAKQFDMVLFRGISRFARDTVDALMMLRTLQAYGLRVVSFEESFDSNRDSAELIFTMHSAVAQYESEKIGIRVRLGNLEKARRGKWCGATPDGYVLNPETKRLEIDPVRAPLIQRIFDLYEEGHGTLRISNILNVEGYRSVQGALWNLTRVRRLLRNPAYCGDVVYGSRERVPAPPTDDNPMARRRRTVFTRDAERIVVCRDAHPALIDRQRFERLQRVMDGRRKMSGRNSMAYLLIGLLKCKCGHSMNTKHNDRGTRYYRCRTRYTCGTDLCDQKYLRANDVEQFVLERVRGDVLVKLDADKLRGKRGAHGEKPLDHSKEIDSAARDLEKEMARSMKLFDRYSDGTLSEGQYVEMNRKVRERIDSLTKTIEDAERKARLIGTAKKTEQDVLDHIQRLLSSEEVTRETLRALVREIRIVASDETELQVQIAYTWG